MESDSSSESASDTARGETSDVDSDAASDAALVNRVLDGDSPAFTLLSNRHSAACLRFAMRMLGDRDEAEDATQESFMRAYRALGTFDTASSFRTWLFAILVNRCRSILTSRTRRERWMVRENAATGSGVVAPHDGQADLRFEIERALRLLPAEQREAFLLKHVEQLEYTEMSEITGANVSALKMRVQRACTHLKAELNDYSPARTSTRPTRERGGAA